MDAARKHDSTGFAAPADANNRVAPKADDERVSVFVRDRGAGFDRATVPADRRGLAESIEGRMVRAGGSASVVSAPGEGTEIELALPRRTA